MGRVLAVLAIASWVGGCGGSSFRRVEEARWRGVPEPVRARIDGANGPQLADALEERRLAADAVADARAALASERLAEVVPTKPQQQRDYGKVGKAWLAEQRAHDQARTKALAYADDRQRAWRRAVLAWHERRLEAAELRVSVTQARLELSKVEAVHAYSSSDDGTGGGEEIDRYRGQWAGLQQAWTQARRRVDAARAEAQRRSHELAEAKEAYARLCREHPEARPAIIVEAEHRLYSPHRVPHIW
jgi:hypothetical protein